MAECDGVCELPYEENIYEDELASTEDGEDSEDISPEREDVIEENIVDEHAHAPVIVD
jgi:hypothetical protein